MNEPLEGTEPRRVWDMPWVEVMDRWILPPCQLAGVNVVAIREYRTNAQLVGMFTRGHNATVTITQEMRLDVLEATVMTTLAALLQAAHDEKITSSQQPDNTHAPSAE